MAKKQKYYVVWNGFEPGIYTDWEACERQINGFGGAKYKSYESLDEAETAFDEGPTMYSLDKASRPKPEDYPTYGIAVDAACSGNPGVMEYKGVDIQSGKRLFLMGPYLNATNNIGEFLAIVHGLALVKNSNLDLPVYSDSVTAISWVKQKRCRSKMPFDKMDSNLIDIIKRAESWLEKNDTYTSLIKWDTSRWGEIPADFGRK